MDLIKKANNRGFTMVEIIMALSITAIMMAVVMAMYFQFSRQMSGHDLIVDAQQSARAGLDFAQKEIVQVGYRVPVEALILAGANEVQFRHVDYDEGTSSDKGFKTKYGMVVDGGVTHMYKTSCESSVDFSDECTNGAPPQNKVISNLVPGTGAGAGLYFQYYNGDGVPFSALDLPLDFDNRKLVRFIRMTVRTQTAAEVRTGDTAALKYFEVSTEVRLRNIDISSSAVDNDAPDAPENLAVRERAIGTRNGICGKLRLRWTKGSEGDLAGYRVYYVLGTASKNVSISLASLEVADPDDGFYYYTLQPAGDAALASTESKDASASPTTYAISVRAYDKSNNTGTASTVTSAGVTGAANTDFGTAGNDTTINPSKPAAVTGFAAVDGAEGEVHLSWDAYDTTNNPDVVGFRIYRNVTSFTSFPIVPDGADIELVADETTITAALTAMPADDNDTDLIGCKTYYYAIAPVSCDTTLISDGDAYESGNDTKYVVADYKGVCGDGAAACTPGTGMASVSGSDSAPSDLTDPSSPSNFGVRAGWQRVAVSFNQPTDTDIYQTCIYTNLGASYPIINTDPFLKDAVGCYNATLGRTVPDSDGAFNISEVAKGAANTFWHDDWNLETPAGDPNLSDGATYSYRTVAFDNCGRASSETSAQATTTLCGQDPPLCSVYNIDGCVDSAADLYPPAVTDLTVTCCGDDDGDGITLSWTEVPSDVGSTSTQSNPWDLAGYRIFRGTSPTDFSAAVLLNTDAPWWGTSYDDATANDGNTYYYRVVSTDCPYERTDPTAATIISNMSFLEYATTGAVSPGKIERDERCEGAGSCSELMHREVLTGVVLDADNVSEPDYDNMSHNTVTLFLKNTSTATQTIQKITVDWTYSSAFLTKVSIGGGRSSVIETITTISPDGSTDEVHTLTNTVINAGAGGRYVPITLEFKDTDGDPIDMREDSINVELSVKNDSTGKTGCVANLSWDGSDTDFTISYGPGISSVQQNLPSNPTFGYAVPGSGGLPNTVPNGSDGPVVVDSGLDVTVSATLIANTIHAQTGNPIPIDSAVLAYLATANTVTTFDNVSGMVFAPMSSVGSNTWEAVIEADDGKRFWYAVIGFDEDGNYAISPDVSLDYGLYTYDQKIFSVCDVVPSAPANLNAVVDVSDNVDLSWDAVTTYTNTAAIHGSDSVSYRIYRDGTAIASQAGTTYQDPTLPQGVYNYTVKAYNSCPITSAASNSSSVCAGAAGSRAVMTVTPTEIFQGGSYNVSILDCLALEPANSGTVEILNTTASFENFDNTSVGGAETYSPNVSETGPATGTFTTTIETADVTTAGKLKVNQTDTISVYYENATPDTFTVTVVADPCDSVPDIVPDFCSGGNVCNKSGNSINLAWSAVTQNDDASAISDLNSYNVYQRVTDNGGTETSPWTKRADLATGITSVTLTKDHGPFNSNIYYFKVRADDTCGTPNESDDATSTVWNE